MSISGAAGRWAAVARGSGRRELAAIALLILLTLPARVIQLGADPPPDLEGAFLTDEAWWGHNARLHTLFGRWVMDEANPGLVAAPLYTVTLAEVYDVLGVGFAQTRLLSGIAGFLTCLVLYLALRRWYPVGPALLPSLLLGTGYFMLTNNRSGLVESFQALLTTTTCLAALHSLRRPWWAAVAGGCLALSLLAKPSAIVIAPVIVVFWALSHRVLRKADGTPILSLQHPVLFVMGAGLVLLVVGVLVVLPHWSDVREQLGISLRMAYTQQGLPARGRILLFGWHAVGMTASGFFRQSLIPLAVIMLFAVARLGRGVRRPVDAPELLCWTWLLVGLGFVATQAYQPDRRFLLFCPAVAVLAGLALRDGGIPLPTRDGFARSSAWWRTLIAGALVGGFLGLYGFPVLVKPLQMVVDRLRGSSEGLSWRGAASLLVNGSLLGGALLMPILRRWLPAAPRNIPAAAFVVLFLVMEPARFVRYAMHPTYTIRDASRDLAARTAGWRPEDRIIVGPFANTLAMETDLFAFQIRRGEALRAYYNQDGWERFHPSLAILNSPNSSAWSHLQDQKFSEEVRARGFVPFQRVAGWPDQRGRAQWEVFILVRPDLCPGCTRPELP